MSGTGNGWLAARELLDGLREGIQVIDPAWQYVYVNAAAARHGRTTADALIGRTMMSCYPGIEQTPMFDRLRRCMDSGLPDQLSNEFRYPDGSVGWFELRIQRVDAGVLVLSYDVTDARLQEERLRQSERLEALGRLAGGVAHDFNNLLTAILAHADFLSQSGGVPDDDEDLGAIRTAALRAATLTRQLLTFARRRPPAAEPVDLRDAATEVLGILDRTLGVEVVRRLHPAPTRLPPGCAEQLVLNLVLNARDALAGSRGRIVVETRTVDIGPTQVVTPGTALPIGRYALLAVSDDGPGIPPELRPRLFEPFVTGKASGTGLGLATCWGIAQQGDGHLRVYSEPGHGATFRVYLPVDGAPTMLTPLPASERRPASESILVVEDDEVVSELMCRALLDAGYRVSRVTSAEAFREAVDGGGSWQMLVMDMILAGINGNDLVRYAQRVLPDVRVLYVSGYTELAIHTRGMVADVLEKPFAPAALVERVRAVLDYDRTP